MDPKLARYMWQLIEPYHAVTYFAPDAIETYERAGLKGGWMGYFAGRAGAMGPVGSGVVTATFYNFHPDMVARSIPDAWTLSSPEKAVAARLQIADKEIRRILGEPPAARELAGLLSRVVESARPEGRPLFAAHALVDCPDEDHLALWWACTALREHRGDGHVSCLVHESIDGSEANVISAAVGAVSASTQKKFRGWSDDDWDKATERLEARGLVDGSGQVTDKGLALKSTIERDTDQLAAEPYSILTDDEVESLISGLQRVVKPAIDAGAIRYPNPMGLTPPVPPR